MVTILEELKELLELEDTTEYDKQLLRIVNSGIAQLANVNIPVEIVTEESTIEAWPKLRDTDAHEVIDWLSWFTLLRFDRKIDRTSFDNTSAIMDDIRARLCIRYDREDRK